MEGGSPGIIQPWDIAYYAEKQRQALYDFDEEVLRPYFPLDRVAVISANRGEMLTAELATMCLGASLMAVTVRLAVSVALL